MKPAHQIIMPRHLIRAALISVCLLASGCATVREETCEQFEANRKIANYATQYVLSKTDTDAVVNSSKPLPRKTSAAVHSYRLHVDPAAIKPCHHLVLHKELSLQLSAGMKQTLEEVREIYTADGALVATKAEIISGQIHSTGYYTSEARLPIPENTPAGEYRLISKIVMKTKKKSQAVVLARTSVNFQVLSRQ